VGEGEHKSQSIRYEMVYPDLKYAFEHHNSLSIRYVTLISVQCAMYDFSYRFTFSFLFRIRSVGLINPNKQCHMRA
jgi:hypothetical protein